MTLSDFEILCNEQARRAIDENIARDPVAIALDKRIEHASLIATQVKRLQRAKSKLPSYYAVRAILPPRAYEQSSSEQCAAQKDLAGESVLDLTCGLGVDSIALSRKFKRVISCEQDSVLAAITKYNMQLLGIENVEVINCSAEEYLAQTTDHFDWVFVDPDRRGAKDEKLVLLEECSPNIISLYQRITEVADKLCIKCSPLFDTAEAFRKFENCSVETVSLGGECKEVNIYINKKRPTLIASAVGLGRFEVEYDKLSEAEFSAPPTTLEHYRYLSLPDVSLVHSRLTAAAFAGRADIWSHNGVALSVEHPQHPLARTFEIAECHSFGSKELKRALKGKGVEIIRRNCPLSTTEITRKYSLRSGAEAMWCFTRIANEFVAIRLSKI